MASSMVNSWCTTDDAWLCPMLVWSLHNVTVSCHFGLLVPGTLVYFIGYSAAFVFQAVCCTQEHDGDDPFYIREFHISMRHYVY